MRIRQDRIDKFEFPEVAEGFKELAREFSPCGRKVIVIGIKPDNTFTYSLFNWDLSEVEYIGSGYWAPCYKGEIFSDFDSAFKKAALDLKTSIAENEYCRLQ
ncbi:MAG: hypothetical protein ABW170_08285 [Candidatus Thiodiazotropha sp. L084R]